MKIVILALLLIPQVIFANTVNNNEPWKTPKIVLIGDSIMAGTEQIVAKKLMDYGYRVHDMTQPGQTLQAASKNNLGNAVNYYNFGINYVVIMLGTNDWARKRNIYDIAIDYFNLIGQIDNSNSEVICLGQPAINEAWFKANPDMPYDLIRSIPILMSNWYGLCNYLDLSETLNNPYNSFMFTDGLHLTRTGQETLADIIHTYVSTE